MHSISDARWGRQLESSTQFSGVNTHWFSDVSHLSGALTPPSLQGHTLCMPFYFFNFLILILFYISCVFITYWIYYRADVLIINSWGASGACLRHIHTVYSVFYPGCAYQSSPCKLKQPKFYQFWVINFVMWCHYAQTQCAPTWQISKTCHDLQIMGRWGSFVLHIKVWQTRTNSYTKN